MTAPVDIGTLIVRTAGTVGGRPRIAGTRIAVDHIAALWKQGYSPEEIAGTVYPHLSLEGVFAALAYYFANRSEVDDRLDKEARLFDQLAATQQRSSG